MRTRRSSSSSDPVSRNPSTSVGGRGHRSVLLHESIEFLAIRRDDIVVDATLGGAGHAKEIVARLGKAGIFVGIDADSDAIERARESLADASATIHLIPGNFRELGTMLERLGIQNVTKVLFDLGWSSYQLDSGRGFSFQKEEPLLMTYSKEPGALTAATIVNQWGESSIADVLYGWGDERYSKRIAQAIVRRRECKKFETSSELAEVIKAAVPAGYRFGKIHPATKTFQALRIAVNDELGAIAQGIAAAWEKLAPGGHIAVITFHSIEDREVKQLFAGLAREGGGTLISKKPVRPGREELAENPRARSAKLRIIQKNHG